MSAGLIEKVKEFLVKLVKDKAFQDRLETSSIDEQNQFLQASGYNFTKQEFEAATLEILESKERGEFNELSNEELVAVVGGYVGEPIATPIYGLPLPPINWPVCPKPKPVPRPLYGAPSI